VITTLYAPLAGAVANLKVVVFTDVRSTSVSTSAFEPPVS
jgi:hypothetical protein